MSYKFRPAVRKDTPVIVGLSGPSKGGKTKSALRLAGGLANGKPVAMINAEGPRGEMYADEHDYLTVDIRPPYRPMAYVEALQAAAEINPGAVIIDSVSHMHDGPGGMLEWHEEELDRMAGKDWDKRKKCTFTAWIAPKAAENRFVYQLLSMNVPIILCMRAKEKLLLRTGKDPLPLGWQPIVSGRVSFETLFTLVLPPQSYGVPDLDVSEMRSPWRELIKKGRTVDEDLGRQIAEWAKGGAKASPPDADAVLEAGKAAAAGGTTAFRRWWRGLSGPEKAIAEPHADYFKTRVDSADAAAGAAS